MLKSRFLTISVLLALLTGFGLSGPASAAVPKEVSVDQSSSGGQISVVVGDTLKVVLNQNSASTGFIWTLVGNSDPSVLNNVGHQTQPLLAPQFGAPGNDIWTFSALKPGTSTILLDYSQPWSGGIKNANNFVLTVNVLDEPAPVPASSGLSTGLMIAILAVFMAFAIMWRLHRYHAHGM